MKHISRKIFLVLLILQFSFLLSAQESELHFEKIDGKNYINGLPVFTDEDLEFFKSIPQLTLPEEYRSREFPVNVNNADLKFFRPIFDQVALECGQASGVAYTFTYEINRLRDLSADEIENQYPTHFVYNWSGNGSGMASSYFDSWNIIKHVGTPNVLEYGGSLSYGGSARWIDGYDVYYSAMKNRLWDFYSIDVTNIDGLNTLRHWIVDHLSGEPTGGIGNVYTAAVGAGNTLPAGTPEAGFNVVLELPTYANHALCIVGYHDSIRYDLNNDGQYTNHLDINGDGVVNIVDWEIGGVLLANSYYASSWGNAGFAYLLYSGLCRKMPQGGCWNGAVSVVNAKENTDPQLTFKAKITHDSRNKIKVMAGVATTPGASEPEYIIDFPILSYQGGDFYMTGGWQEEDKTLEFGLDVTPLLAHLENGQNARFFFMVDEKDPSNIGTGMINNFSLMDYTDFLVETPCTQTNVPLVENGLTTLYVDAVVSFENPMVLNLDLPPAVINEPYSNQMIGTCGTEPYQWKVKKKYTSQQGFNTFPMINGEQLFPTDLVTGYATQAIDFEFPFYGKTYSQITMHTDGYILFAEDHYPWKFIIDQQNLFKNMRHISPLMSFTLGVESGGMWYEGNSLKATFRWLATEYATGNVSNFAVSLYPDGKIEFYYGDCEISWWNYWYMGVSEGDAFNYDMLETSNQPIQANTMITMMPDFNSTEMNISENGLFAGLPTHPYEAIDVEFSLKDANGLQNSKTLTFSTEGVNDIVIRDVFVQAGNNSIIENGETVTLGIELKNIGTETVNASLMKIFTNNVFVSITDSLATLQSFAPGETKIIESAFQFEVSNQVPNGHDLIFTTAIVAETKVYNAYMYLKAYAPVLKIGNVEYEDGNNGYPEPGETIDMLVDVKNIGGGMAYNIQTLLSNSDPFITITSNEFTLSSIAGGASGVAKFVISINESTPMGYTSQFNVSANADFGFSTADVINIIVGVLMEDFETASFDQFDWQFSGDSIWSIDYFDPYQGDYCMRSGVILDNQTSVASITMDVLLDSEISFYYKVSSEPNYDFLRFYIDGVQMAQWSGEEGWGLANFPVSTGERTFSWAYEKDYSVSTEFDCGFIDFIFFPPSGHVEMAVSAGPNISVCEGQSAQTTAFIVNASAIEWASDGDGTFDNAALINPVYTPGQNDISVGIVELSVIAWDDQGDTQTDNTTLYIYHMPIVFAGDDIVECDNVAAIAVSGVAFNSNGFYWFTQGDGNFANPLETETYYYPGPNDLESGSVTLKLSGLAQAPCQGLESDELLLTFLPAPEIIFDELPVLGLNSSPYELVEASPAGGTYSGPGVVDGWLYPGVAGIGTHTILYTLEGENGCIDVEEQIIFIRNYVGLYGEQHPNIQIFPNPGNGIFRILNQNHSSQNVLISIYNANGERVFEKEAQGSDFKIDCSNQPSGLYYLKIKAEDDILTRKLVIKK